MGSELTRTISRKSYSYSEKLIISRLIGDVDLVSRCEISNESLKDLDTSRNLNSILNDLGLTKRSISNRRYGMQLYNLMTHIRHGMISDDDYICYLSGSSVEGVASVVDPNSDIDIMVICPINVINDIDQIDNQVRHFPIRNGVFILEDSISNCLFKRLRLQCIAGANMENHYHHSNRNSFTHEKYCFHSNGNIYLSHANVSDVPREIERMENDGSVRRLLNLENLGNMYSGQIEHCGPSINIKITGLWSELFDIDYVLSVFCPFWPNEIGDFFVRHRPQQWPTPRDLDLIIRNGYHLVAKGFERSIKYDIEWRLSFSFAENMLIRSFNNIQMKCYFLLKAFLKGNIKPRFPKLLCSYHMKTVMFWVCEEIGSNPFKQRYLLKCFRLCIERIRRFLLEGHFPCYFARESNLLSEAVPSEAYRKLAEFLSIVYHEETITTSVRNLKGKSQTFLFMHLPSEIFQTIIMNAAQFKRAMEYYVNICERKSPKEMQSVLNCSIFAIYKRSLLTAYSEWNILNVLRQIVFPDLVFTAIAHLSRRQLRNKVHYALHNQYLQLMTNELAVTHSNGLLKRATVYYKTGQFTRCMVIVVNAISLLTHVLCYGVHNEEQFNLSLQLRLLRFFGSSPDLNVYTRNVIFSQLDKPLVPDFVIEEINFDEHINDKSTKGWAYFDPVIYAYGLAIICQHELLDFVARDQFLQELKYFFLQNKHRIVYHNSAKRIIDHFNGHFCRR